MKRALLPIAAIGAALLAGCSSASETAAQDAYDQCFNAEAEFSLLEVEGSTVQIVVEGEAARALAGTDGEIDQVLAGDGPAEGELTGLGVSLAMLTTIDCLVEVTDYPGSSDQLAEGDAWEGWEYSYTDGAGSSFTASFTSTS